MSNDTKYTNNSDSLFDIDGYKVEIEQYGSGIRLYGWNITEDSKRRPHETHADTLHLTRRQAVELARRLFNAAAE